MITFANLSVKEPIRLKDTLTLIFYLPISYKSNDHSSTIQKNKYFLMHNE